jgi:aryl-alcohol dehydrogenase-like predicted oxidoreductase
MPGVFMEYRNLGRSGLKVSPLCLGAMMFGGATDEATSARIIDKAKSIGVNFIDTADAYNEGASEQVVGRAIAADRGWWVLATKLANRTEPGPNGIGLSRRYVIRAAEASLRRLGTDVIDVLYLHKEDHATPLSEVVHAMADLVRAGKIRHFGVSNHRAWRVAEICRLCDLAGIDRPVVSQPLYNALNRMVEVEHLPACSHLGLGVFPYSPLARGVLTGKYTPDHAATRGVAASQFALAWVLNNRLVTGAVTGPRTEAQWDDYAGALDYRFTAEDEAIVDRLVIPGHPSTPGYNDPAYPLEGRIVRA